MTIAPGNAADLGTLPVYRAQPAYVPVPVFSWTGCYRSGRRSSRDLSVFCRMGVSVGTSGKLKGLTCAALRGDGYEPARANADDDSRR
jgi:hypothetical protein